MIQQFIKQNNSETLLLFFAGWGMDATPFENTFKGDNDVCICYDYTTLDFDYSILAPYQNIKVIAWSLGVWVANYILSDKNLSLESATAINGTCEAIDDQKGIPVDIYMGTLNGLNDRSLEKFNLRMCGKASLKKLFDSVRPKRSLNSLKDELQALYYHITSKPLTVSIYSKAIIGQNDRIFPAQNQKLAWSGLDKEITDDAHLPINLLEGYE